MIEEEFKKLLGKSWNDHERAIIQKIMDGLLYYRKLLPRSLKGDVIAALQLCNELKDKLDTQNSSPLHSLPQESTVTKD